MAIDFAARTVLHKFASLGYHPHMHSGDRSWYVLTYHKPIDYAPAVKLDCRAQTFTLYSAVLPFFGKVEYPPADWNLDKQEIKVRLITIGNALKALSKVDYWEGTGREM